MNSRGRILKLRETLTRERKLPGALERFVPGYRSSEQRKRDSDAVIHWAVRVVPLGIALGLLLFGVGWAIITLLAR